MATRRINNLPRSALGAEQKIAFALFVFLAVGGIFFGARSFAANLYRPIHEQFAKYYTGEDVVNMDADKQKEMEEQKTKDTDRDGLSDYDELYIYKTSPYLTDSDSDTFDDKTEVFSNNDPNCPSERSCSAVGSSEESRSGSSASVEGVLEFVPDKKSVLESGKMKFENKAQIEAFFKSATMEEIRAALISSGMKQEDIDALSDEQLSTLFSQAVGTASDSGKLDAFVSEQTEQSLKE